MNKNKQNVLDYLDLLDEDTKRKCVIAIKDMLADGRDYEFIDVALHKKSPDVWAEWSFGLCFNNRFIASVYKAIQRNKDTENVDVDKFIEQLKSDEPIDNHSKSTDYQSINTVPARKNLVNLESDSISFDTRNKQQNISPTRDRDYRY